jgi:hypothetical protein
MELAHCVDRLQDENDELRKMMGWLSGHEPQLRMMIEAYKHYDGQALGANKVGEGNGENERKIRDIPEPPKTHHKNAYAPKPNPLRNRLDTTPAPPVFPPHTDNFQKPIKFNSDLVLTVDYRIKVRLDLQANKSSIVVKGPSSLKCEPKVSNPWNNV